MPETFKLPTLISTIAGLTIPVVNAQGSTVNLRLRAKPVGKVLPEECPLMTVRPDNCMTGLSITRDTHGADAAYKSAQYELHYMFYFAPVLQGTDMFEKYLAAITAVSAILLYFSTHTDLAGSTDFLPQTIPHVGAVADSTGTKFHGCELAFHVMQYLEG